MASPRSRLVRADADNGRSKLRLTAVTTTWAVKKTVMELIWLIERGIGLNRKVVKLLQQWPLELEEMEMVVRRNLFGDKHGDKLSK
jgi:hypothetical protein